MCPVTSERRTRLAIATAANLRDLGGWPTKDGGHVRSGVVYRSAELSRLHGDDDLAAFGELGVRTVYDLRTAAEVAHQPDALPDGLEPVNLDVLADARHAAPAELQRIFEDPSRANEFLREGQAERYFETAYRGFVTLDSARSAYRRLFEGIAAADGPVLYHCATGKDRTGWATAVLFLLLGVPDDEVLEEYLLTNTELLPMVQPWLDQFAAGGGDPELLMPVLGVQESYLAAALAQMEESFGGLEDYLTTGLGLSPATIEALREKLR
jgi:protein-tyrosine phosphatase